MHVEVKNKMHEPAAGKGFEGLFICLDRINISSATKLKATPPLHLNM